MSVQRELALMEAYTGAVGAYDMLKQASQLLRDVIGMNEAKIKSLEASNSTLRVENMGLKEDLRIWEDER